jgi:hypothetical protein
MHRRLAGEAFYAYVLTGGAEPRATMMAFLGAWHDLTEMWSAAVMSPAMSVLECFPDSHTEDFLTGTDRATMTAHRKRWDTVASATVAEPDVSLDVGAARHISHAALMTSMMTVFRLNPEIRVDAAAAAAVVVNRAREVRLGVAVDALIRRMRGAGIGTWTDSEFHRVARGELSDAFKNAGATTMTELVNGASRRLASRFSRAEILQCPSCGQGVSPHCKTKRCRGCCNDTACAYHSVRLR